MGLTTNPDTSQYAGVYNTASKSATPALSRPSDPESIRRSIALHAGGTTTQPTQSKIPAAKGVQDVNTDSNTTTPTQSDLLYYAWNLPPHQWSKPLDPVAVDSIVSNNSGWSAGVNSLYRRGRIYYYRGIDSTQINANEFNTGNNLADRRYGLQFLWNPESFSTSVSVNMDITPSAQDKFVKVVGAFPSSEVLTVEFMLDRTNDLYCLRSSEGGVGLDISNFYRYYTGSFDSLNPSMKVFDSKIRALRDQGTVADLEYLYKAINGAGWKNAATGRESSDIGFLSPTLLKIEIGPVAYIGYVSNLNVQHTRFTKGMIPMNTMVAIQFNLMATAGLSSRQ